MELVHKPWHWAYISSSPNITINNIISNDLGKWDWACVSSNPNLTVDDIINNPCKNWHWGNISINKFSKDLNVSNRIHKTIRKREILYQYLCKYMNTYIAFDTIANVI